MKHASLAVAFLLAAGCTTSLEGSYWIPDFSSTQSSGTGGTSLDLDSQLGVAADESALVYELVGDQSRMGEQGWNRIRLEYWMIRGKGVTDQHGGFLFDTLDYPALDEVATEIEIQALGVLWEPALIRTQGFRLRLIVGANLLRFNMTVEDVDNPALAGKLEVPGEEGPLSDMGLEYIPVPLAGVGFEAAFSPWAKLVARGQMFDAKYLELSEDFGATFMTGVAGLLLGRARGIRVFAGYRYFHTEYRFEEDTGESTLSGPVATVSLRF